MECYGAKWSYLGHHTDEHHHIGEVEVEVVLGRCQAVHGKSIPECELHQDKMGGRKCHAYLDGKRQDLEGNEMETALRK